MPVATRERSTASLTREFGEPAYDRVEAPATADQKKRLAALSPEQMRCAELAGEKVQSIINEAPGNHAPIGGVKVTAATGWFAARPSGTEDIYKIYAESFRGKDQLASNREGSARDRGRRARGGLRRPAAEGRESRACG